MNAWNCRIKHRKQLGCELVVIFHLVQMIRECFLWETQKTFKTKKKKHNAIKYFIFFFRKLGTCLRGVDTDQTNINDSQKQMKELKNEM